MNTLLLRYAVEVERAGSISKAAEHLYMNQPHLSKAIRELEKTVGISIFCRSAKGVVPTPKGTVFLEHAKTVLEQIEKMETLCCDTEQSVPEFSVAVPHASYITHAFASLVEQVLPSNTVRMNYYETSIVHTMDGVASGELNLGIVRCKAADEPALIDAFTERELKWRLLLEYTPVLLLSRKHPLAGCMITEAELKGYTEIRCEELPLVGMHRGKKQMGELQEKRKLEIVVHERGSRLELLCAVPTTYAWSAPVPEALLKRYDLVQKTCSDLSSEPIRDYLIFHKDYSFSKRDTLFTDLLTQCISSTKCVKSE